MSAPESFTIHSGNVDISGVAYPCPGRETVLLLHGGPGVPDEMTEVREYLNSRMQVITFDQRGTGADQRKRTTFSMPDYIGDIQCIADRFGLARLHLFGHSWGGLYAQVYADRHPDRIASLFLCSPASGTGKKIWELTEKEVLQYNRKRSTTGEWLLMGLNSLLGMLGSSRAYRRLYRQVIINYHKGFQVEPPAPEKLKKINASAGNKTRQAIKQYPPLKIFGETPYPVLITYGQHDAYGKSRDFVTERFPCARIITIPDCGHTPWKHNLSEFRKTLESFYEVFLNREAVISN